jgi:sec-independent protein translocase protein TatA
MGFKGWEILIVALVIIVLFGGSQLPKIAKNLGQAQKELRKGFEEGQEESDDSTEA